MNPILSELLRDCSTILKYSSYYGMFFGTTIGLGMGDIKIDYKNSDKNFDKKWYMNTNHSLKIVAPIFLGSIFGVIFPLSIIALPFSLITFITNRSYIDDIIDNVLEKYTIEAERCYQHDDRSKYGYPSILCIEINKKIKNENKNDR